MARRPAHAPPKATLLVADAGPLIVLGLADLLAPTVSIFGPLAVPSAVLDECLFQPGLPAESAISQALAAQQLLQVDRAPRLPLDASSSPWQGLGAGETAVLAYARTHALTALIDDQRGRRAAQRLAVPLIGSGAIALNLKRAGRIASVRSVLDRWERHGYFIGASVRRALLDAAGEAV